jgi:hypothetical protein
MDGSNDKEGAITAKRLTGTFSETTAVMELFWFMPGTYHDGGSRILRSPTADDLFDA